MPHSASLRSLIPHSASLLPIHGKARRLLPIHGLQREGLTLGKTSLIQANSSRLSTLIRTSRRLTITSLPISLTHGNTSSRRLLKRLARGHRSLLLKRLAHGNRSLLLKRQAHGIPSLSSPTTTHLRISLSLSPHLLFPSCTPLHTSMPPHQFPIAIRVPSLTLCAWLSNLLTFGVQSLSSINRLMDRPLSAEK